MTGRQTDLCSWVSQRLLSNLRQGPGATRPGKIPLVCGGSWLYTAAQMPYGPPLQVCEALTFSLKEGSVYCPQCQQENPAHANFCLHCGTRLATVCPQCQQVLPPEAKFCLACGQALPAASQPAPLLEVQIGSGCTTDDGTRMVECPLRVRSAHHSPYTGTKENSMQFP